MLAAARGGRTICYGQATRIREMFPFLFSPSFDIRRFAETGWYLQR
jgi:hypothetical protein